MKPLAGSKRGPKVRAILRERHRGHRRVSALAAITVLALVVAGCDAPNSPDASAAPSASWPLATEHNESDTQFAQMMVIHHEGAIEMADEAAERATTTAVRDLALRIRAAQDPEIDKMEAWLASWGEDAPLEADMMGMEHDGMAMGAMDQQEAMKSLSNASGVQVDREFLELMILHHFGAVEMAEEQVATGQNSGAVDLARDIIEAQESEIAEMKEMLNNLAPE